MNQSGESSPEPEWQQSIYDELHRLAEAALRRETPGHSLQPTLLVHDAYLKLAAQRNLDPGDRSLYLAAGGNIIRRLLVDYARARKARKRGGEQGRGIPLPVSIAVDASQVDILELDEALTHLAKNYERAAKVVELKFFSGLSGEEISKELEVSLRTVNNDWRFAKAWLYRELDSEIDEQANDR